MPFTDVAEAFKLPTKKGFKFLSIGKWEERKGSNFIQPVLFFLQGWDSLLRAYFEEFSATDDVALFIRASLDGENQKAFQKLKADFLATTNQTGGLFSFEIRANRKNT